MNKNIFQVEKYLQSKKSNTMTSKGFKSTIYGCTCDGIDRLVEDIMLPDLMCGEYLYFENMGLYTGFI